MLIFQKKKNVVGLVFKDTITKKLMWSINCIFFFIGLPVFSLSLSRTRVRSQSPSHSLTSLLPFLHSFLFFLTSSLPVKFSYLSPTLLPRFLPSLSFLPILRSFVPFLYPSLFKSFKWDQV